MITKDKIKKIIIMLIVMLVCSITCVFYNLINPKIVDLFYNRFNVVSSKNNLLVHFISIGQGDAIAINLPDGKVMLIDTGLKSTNVTYTDYLQEKVLNSKLNNKIDYLFLTHADADHVGSTLRVLKEFQVGTIYLPAVSSSTLTYLEIENYVTNNCNYEYVDGDFNLSNSDCGYEIEIFGPVNFDNTNDSCQIIKVTYLNTSFLFTGDISDDVEKRYLANYGNKIDADVLKVAHHGSSTSSCAEFVDEVSPKYSVICVGAGNSFGHPTEQTINTLYEANSKVFRTDVDGNIMFVVGANYGLNYKTRYYYITNLSLDYRYIVLVVDGIFVINIVVILIKRDKKEILKQKALLKLNKNKKN